MTRSSPSGAGTWWPSADLQWHTVRGGIIPSRSSSTRSASVMVEVAQWREEVSSASSSASAASLSSDACGRSSSDPAGGTDPDGAASAVAADGVLEVVAVAVGAASMFVLAVCVDAPAALLDPSAAVVLDGKEAMAQRFLAAGDCGGERKKKKWEVREGMDRSDPKDKGNPYKWAAPRFVQRSGEWRNFRHASVRTVVIVGFFSTTPRKSRAG